jgi:DNA-binding LacI/PurR family transcriptional regulator
VVGSDNHAGGVLAAKQLISDKRKRFLFLGDISHPEIKNRYLGFIDTLRAYGLDGNQKSISAGFSVQSGYDQILNLMLHKEGFDAVFAASDQIAMGAIKALQAHGKHVPKDVSVVDYIPFASYFSPPLTTIKQDIEAGGKLLVSKLIALLNGKTPKSHFLAPTLITGGSCLKARP